MRANTALQHCGNTLSLEYPALALVTLLCVVLAQDLTISRLDGLLFVLTYIGFTAYLVYVVRKQLTVQEVKNLSEEVTELTPEKKPSAIICGILLVAGIALLGLGPVDRVGCKSTGATVGLVRETYWFDNRIRWNRLAGSRCVAGIQSAWSQRCGNWQRDRIQSVQHSDDSRADRTSDPASRASVDCQFGLLVDAGSNRCALANIVERSPDQSLGRCRTAGGLCGLPGCAVKPVRGRSWYFAAASLVSYGNMEAIPPGGLSAYRSKTQRILNDSALIVNVTLVPCE